MTTNPRLRCLARLRAFLLGMREFRLDCTHRHGCYDLRESYDGGRDLVHRLTLRRWDG